jgi:hypothetical protein
VGRKTRLRLSLVAGLNRTNLTLQDGGDIKLASGLQPILGLGMRISPGSFNEKLSISAELLYHKNHIQGNYERSGSGINVFGTAQGTTEMNWHQLQVPLMLRYTLLNSGALRPFIQAGPQALLRLKPSAVYTRTEKIPGQADYVVAREVEIKALGFGGTAGAGLQIALGRAGSLCPEVRYGTTDNASTGQKVSPEGQLNFLLGYTFGL